MRPKACTSCGPSIFQARPKHALSVERIFVAIDSSHPRPSRPHALEKELPRFSIGASSAAALSALGIFRETRWVEVHDVVERTAAKADLEGGVVPRLVETLPVRDSLRRRLYLSKSFV